MYNLSQYARSGISYQTFLNQSFVTPSSLAIVLCSTVPTVNSYTELGAGAVAGGYTRQQYNANAGNWNYAYPASGICFNNNTITFAKATTDWGWCSGLVITDNSNYSSGNMWFYGPVTPVELGVNSQVIISPSALSVQYS